MLLAVVRDKQVEALSAALGPRVVAPPPIEVISPPEIAEAPGAAAPVEGEQAAQAADAPGAAAPAESEQAMQPPPETPESQQTEETRPIPPANAESGPESQTES